MNKLINRNEQLHAKFKELVEEKHATSAVRIEVKPIGEHSYMVRNINNFKTMRLDYLPEVHKVMVEARGERNPWLIPEPADEIAQMAYNLLKQVT